MTLPWGINWLCYHKDQNDFPHIEKMGYASFTIYEWMWNNRDFCNDLVAASRKDAIFLNRDQPMSEQKDDQWKNDPAGKGRNHADDWAQKVKDGKVFTPLDRTYFLGLNEPNSEMYQRQIDAYNEAFCRRMTEHGLRVAAYSFGVGHPSTVDLKPENPPDWHWYEASAAAVLEGGHIVATHEYGSHDNYGWGYWCGRIAYCPYPFTVIFDECGIDNGVTGGPLYGYQMYMEPLAAYCGWLDGFQVGQVQRAPSYKVKVHSSNIFCFDSGRSESKDWHSYDIRPIRPDLEAFHWTEVQAPVQPDNQPVTIHLPSISNGAHPTTYYVFPIDGLNLRAAPSQDSASLAVASYGDAVELLGFADGGRWANVTYNGQTGWMSWIYLRDSKPAPIAPVQPSAPSGDDNWPRIYAFIRKWEGGWSNNPADPGGATNKGITYGTFVKWRTSQGKPAPTIDDLCNISDVETEQIYHDWYYVASGSDKLPWPLSLANADTAVNAGVGQAQKMLAQSDGNFLSYVGQLIQWYASIPNFGTFGRAWMNRRGDLLVEASKR